MQVSPDQLDAGAAGCTLGWNYQRGRKGGGDRHDGRHGEYVLQHAMGILVNGPGTQRHPREVGCDAEGIAVRGCRICAAEAHNVRENARTGNCFGLPDVTDGAGYRSRSWIVAIGHACRRRGQHAPGLVERQ